MVTRTAPVNPICLIGPFPGCHAGSVCEIGSEGTKLSSAGGACTVAAVGAAPGGRSATRWPGGGCTGGGCAAPDRAGAAPARDAGAPAAGDAGVVAVAAGRVA